MYKFDNSLEHGHGTYSLHIVGYKSITREQVAYSENDMSPTLHSRPAIYSR